jgi:hypothetical protein
MNMQPMNMRNFLFGFAMISASTLFYTCDDEKTQAAESSLAHIQQEIFDTSCALSGCHASTSDATFGEHQLILKAGEAYANLFNVDPTNEHAREDGLKRLVPGDPEQSLLLHKLHCDAGHHSSDYGNMMPIGRDPLSKGQIEYITKWIEQGAPPEGMIDADVNLLHDNVPGCDEDFAPLAAPAPGEGYQLMIDPFEIKPNFEREIFVYKSLANEEEFYVNKITMKMRRNSHHFLVTTFDEAMPENLVPAINEVRDLRDASGTNVGKTLQQMSYHLFTIASQTAEMEYNFPDGVALKMPVEHKLDVNLHYVNKSMNTILGECYINLYKADAATVRQEAIPLFISTEGSVLPANSKTVVIDEFTTPVPMKIFMLTSHTHKAGERFEIQIKGGARNGEVIYTSDDWHHPTIKTYDKPLELNVGEGLRMVITYNNITDKNIKFGLTSEDEMGIIFGYYY